MLTHMQSQSTRIGGMEALNLENHMHPWALCEEPHNIAFGSKWIHQLIVHVMIWLPDFLISHKW